MSSKGIRHKKNIDFTEDEIAEIFKQTYWILDKSLNSIRERIYCIENNINEDKLCPVCLKKVNFLRDRRYAEYCSSTCRANSEIEINKRKETSREKYGTDYYISSKEVKEKSKQTSLTKYGVENPSQSQEVKDKISISKVKHFQARRNDEGTDYAGVVYILHFPQHSAVKIGLSVDFDQRAKGLISDFGEYDIIDIIETDMCFKLESSLHKKFSEHRLCLDAGCGRTEFFNEDILCVYNKGVKPLLTKIGNI
jgi:hypothetical protein